MKKILSAVLAAAMMVGLCACSKTENTASEGEKFVVGITYFEPMNYFDENGELIGFETEFTKAVCEKMGKTPVFQEIEWEKKELELNSKTIDAIWNGLTVTEERKENMAFSTPYIRNKQVAVIKADNADKFATIDAMTGIKVAAESGSAGQDAIEANEILAADQFIGCAAQKDVLLELKAGTIDVGVMDYVMAKASIGEGTDYSDLMIVPTVDLMPEEYAVGLRLDDAENLNAINKAIDEMVADGSLLALCEKYDLADVYAFAEN